MDDGNHLNSQSLTENLEENSLDKTPYETCLGKGQRELECLEGMMGYHKSLNERKVEITSSTTLGVISELISTILIMQGTLKWA